MKMTRKVVITLTGEEKKVLREADEIIVGIVDALLDNKANGHTPWQEGMIISECFWDLRHHIYQIDHEELIP